MKKLVALILAMMLAIGCISFASAEDEKVLKVGLASMSAQFDPGYSIGIQTIKVFYNIYDTLLTTSPEGEIVGQLAESWNWVDDKTLDVKIRPNVTFHNGEACTSEDVFYTFDRFLQGFGDGTVRVLYETLDKVEIIDELTVRFYLTLPSRTAWVPFGAPTSFPRITWKRSARKPSRRPPSAPAPSRWNMPPKS